MTRAFNDGDGAHWRKLAENWHDGVEGRRPRPEPEPLEHVEDVFRREQAEADRKQQEEQT